VAAGAWDDDLTRQQPNNQTTEQPNSRTAKQLNNQAAPAQQAATMQTLKLNNATL